MATQSVNSKQHNNSALLLGAGLAVASMIILPAFAKNRTAKNKIAKNRIP